MFKLGDTTSETCSYYMYCQRESSIRVMNGGIDGAIDGAIDGIVGAGRHITISLAGDRGRGVWSWPRSQERGCRFDLRHSHG